ncbi:MAG TPA: hypothetical protein QGG47_13170 [Acidobacteriota bacterium]|nr:hypothetical protein [Acidobacteriota bacterium]
MFFISSAPTPPTTSTAPDARDLAGRLERHVQRVARVLKRDHLPHGAVFDPVYAGPSSSEIVRYTHAGDSAIWTGHHLAAAAFEYAVTGSKKAKSKVRRAVAAIRVLLEVTGNDTLARGAVPKDSRWIDAITVGEAHQRVFSGSYRGVDYRWAGTTSRDQYSGVIFGLGFAWELVPLSGIRDEIREIVTRLVDYLRNGAWTVRNPDGTISTTFVARPEQMLAFLQVARLVNPGRFTGPYGEVRDAFGTLVGLPITLEITDLHGSYFKFNLDAINLAHLVRLEEPGRYLDEYRKAYDTLRGAVGSHQNAHFNMIDHVIKGPNGARDRETRRLLRDWLKRPRRNVSVDLGGTYPVCGENLSCAPIPVAERVTTDFLWQRDPFVLSGGGGGDVGAPGIDLLLPYWMARYYGVL